MKLEWIIMLVWFVGSLIIQMVYFLKDDRTENHTDRDLFIKKVWHAAAGSIHVWGAVVMGKLYGLEVGIFTAAVTWFFFDGAINTWVLNREWFYIGTTAQIDIIQQKLGKWLHTDPRTVSAVIKCLFLLGVTINLFIV